MAGPAVPPTTALTLDLGRNTEVLGCGYFGGLSWGCTNTKNMLYLFSQELFFNQICEHNLETPVLLQSLRALQGDFDSCGLFSQRCLNKTLHY